MVTAVKDGITTYCSYDMAVSGTIKPQAVLHTPKLKLGICFGKTANL